MERRCNASVSEITLKLFSEIPKNLDTYNEVAKTSTFIRLAKYVFDMCCGAEFISDILATEEGQKKLDIVFKVMQAATNNSFLGSNEIDSKKKYIDILRSYEETTTNIEFNSPIAAVAEDTDLLSVTAALLAETDNRTLDDIISHYFKTPEATHLMSKVKAKVKEVVSKALIKDEIGPNYLGIAPYYKDIITQVQDGAVHDVTEFIRSKALGSIKITNVAVTKVPKTYNLLFVNEIMRKRLYRGSPVKQVKINVDGKEYAIRLYRFNDILPTSTFNVKGDFDYIISLPEELTSLSSNDIEQLGNAIGKDLDPNYKTHILETEINPTPDNNIDMFDEDLKVTLLVSKEIYPLLRAFYPGIFNALKRHRTSWHDGPLFQEDQESARLKLLKSTTRRVRYIGDNDFGEPIFEQVTDKDKYLIPQEFDYISEELRNRISYGNLIPALTEGDDPTIPVVTAENIAAFLREKMQDTSDPNHEIYASIYARFFAEDTYRYIDELGNEHQHVSLYSITHGQGFINEGKVEKMAGKHLSEYIESVDSRKKAQDLLNSLITSINSNARNVRVHDKNGIVTINTNLGVPPFRIIIDEYKANVATELALVQRDRAHIINLRESTTRTNILNLYAGLKKSAGTKTVNSLKIGKDIVPYTAKVLNYPTEGRIFSISFPDVTMTVGMVRSIGAMYGFNMSRFSDDKIYELGTKIKAKIGNKEHKSELEYVAEMFMNFASGMARLDELSTYHNTDINDLTFFYSDIIDTVYENELGSSANRFEYSAAGNKVALQSPANMVNRYKQILTRITNNEKDLLHNSLFAEGRVTIEAVGNKNGFQYGQYAKENKAAIATETARQAIEDYMIDRLLFKRGTSIILQPLVMSDRPTVPVAVLSLNARSGDISFLPDTTAPYKSQWYDKHKALWYENQVKYYQNYSEKLKEKIIRILTSYNPDTYKENELTSKSLDSLVRTLRQEKIPYKWVRSNVPVEVNTFITNNDGVVDIPQSHLDKIKVFSVPFENNEFIKERLETERKVFTHYLKEIGYTPSLQAIQKFSKLLGIENIPAGEAALEMMADMYFFNHLVFGTEFGKLFNSGEISFKVASKKDSVVTLADKFSMEKKEDFYLRILKQAQSKIDLDTEYERSTIQEAIQTVLRSNRLSDVNKGKLIAQLQFAQYDESPFIEQMKRNQPLGSTGQQGAFVSANKPGFLMLPKLKTVYLEDIIEEVPSLSTFKKEAIDANDGVMFVHDLYQIMMNNSLGNQESNYSTVNNSPIKNVTISRNEDGLISIEKKASFNAFNNKSVSAGDPLAHKLLKAMSSLPFNEENPEEGVNIPVPVVDKYGKIMDTEYQAVTREMWLNGGYVFNILKVYDSSNGVDMYMTVDELLESYNEDEIEELLSKGYIQSKFRVRNFKNAYELWLYFGSLHNKDAWKDVAHVLGNYTQATDVELSDIIVPLRDKVIYKLGFESQLKVGQTIHVSNQEIKRAMHGVEELDFSNKWVETSMDNDVIILNSAHNPETSIIPTLAEQTNMSEDEDPSLLTNPKQFINAAVFEGRSFKEVKNIKHGLHVFSDLRIKLLKDKVLEATLKHLEELRDDFPVMDFSAIRLPGYGIQYHNALTKEAFTEEEMRIVRERYDKDYIRENFIAVIYDEEGDPVSKPDYFNKLTRLLKHSWETLQRIPPYDQAELAKWKQDEVNKLMSSLFEDGYYMVVKDVLKSQVEVSNINGVIRDMVKSDDNTIEYDENTGRILKRLSFDLNQVLPFTQIKLYSLFIKHGINLKFRGGQYVVAPSHMTHPTYNFNLNVDVKDVLHYALTADNLSEFKQFREILKVQILKNRKGDVTQILFGVGNSVIPVTIRKVTEEGEDVYKFISALDINEESPRELLTDIEGYVAEDFIEFAEKYSENPPHIVDDDALLKNEQTGLTKEDYFSRTPSYLLKQRLNKLLNATVHQSFGEYNNLDRKKLNGIIKTMYRKSLLKLRLYNFGRQPITAPKLLHPEDILIPNDNAITDYNLAEPIKVMDLERFYIINRNRINTDFETFVRTYFTAPILELLNSNLIKTNRLQWQQTYIYDEVLQDKIPIFEHWYYKLMQDLNGNGEITFESQELLTKLAALYVYRANNKEKYPSINNEQQLIESLPVHTKKELYEAQLFISKEHKFKELKKAFNDILNDESKKKALFNGLKAELQAILEGESEVRSAVTYAEHYSPAIHKIAFLLNDDDSLQDIFGNTPDPDWVTQVLKGNLTQEQAFIIETMYDQSGRKLLQDLIDEKDSDDLRTYKEQLEDRRNTMYSFFSNRIKSRLHKIHDYNELLRQLDKAKTPESKDINIAYVTKLATNLRRTLKGDPYIRILDDAIEHCREVKNSNEREEIRIALINLSAKLDEYRRKKARVLTNNFELSLRFITGRIPAQGKQSMNAGRIKQFRNDQYNCNWAPIEMVLITGADYDIDKQNLMAYMINNDYEPFSWADYTDDGTEDGIISKKKFEEKLQAALAMASPQEQERVRKIEYDKFYIAVHNYIIYNFDKVIRAPKNQIEATTPVVISTLYDYIYKESYKKVEDKLSDRGDNLYALLSTRYIPTNMNPLNIFRFEEIASAGKQNVSISASQIRTNSTVEYAILNHLSEDRYLHPDKKPQIHNFAFNPIYDKALNNALYAWAIQHKDKIQGDIEDFKNSLFYVKTDESGEVEKVIPLHLVANIKQFVENQEIEGTVKTLSDTAKYYRTKLRETDDVDEQVKLINEYLDKTSILRESRIEPQVWQELSQILSAATDNAKTLILGRIGVSSVTNGLISSMLHSGVPLGTAIEMIRKAEEFDKKNKLRVLSAVRDHQDIFKRQNPTITTYSTLAIAIENYYEKTWKGRINHASSQKELNSLIEQIFKDPLMQLLPFVKLQNEFTIITTLSGISTNAKAVRKDSYAMMKRIESAINSLLQKEWKNRGLQEEIDPLDFEKFVYEAARELDDPNYKSDYVYDQIKQFNKIRTGINVLYILRNNQDLVSYYLTMMEAKHFTDNVQHIDNIAEKLINKIDDELAIPYGTTISDHASLMEHMRNYISELAIDMYLDNKYMTIDGITYNLGRIENGVNMYGRLQFIHDMAYTILPKALNSGKAGVANNPLIQKIILMIKPDGKSRTNLPILKGTVLNNLNPEEFTELRLYASMLKEADPTLYEALMTYYFIVDRGKFGGGSLTGLSQLEDFADYSEFLSKNLQKLEKIALDHYKAFSLLIPDILPKVNTFTSGQKKATAWRNTLEMSNDGMIMEDEMEFRFRDDYHDLSSITRQKLKSLKEAEENNVPDTVPDIFMATPTNIVYVWDNVIQMYVPWFQKYHRQVNIFNHKGITDEDFISSKVGAILETEDATIQILGQLTEEVLNRIKNKLNFRISAEDLKKTMTKYYIVKYNGQYSFMSKETLDELIKSTNSNIILGTTGIELRTIKGNRVYQKGGTFPLYQDPDNPNIFYSKNNRPANKALTLRYYHIPNEKIVNGDLKLFIHNPNFETELGKILNDVANSMNKAIGQEGIVQLSQDQIDWLYGLTRTLVQADEAIKKNQATTSDVVINNNIVDVASIYAEKMGENIPSNNLDKFIYIYQNIKTLEKAYHTYLNIVDSRKQISNTIKEKMKLGDLVKLFDYDNQQNRLLPRFVPTYDGWAKDSTNYILNRFSTYGQLNRAIRLLTFESEERFAKIANIENYVTGFHKLILNHLIADKKILYTDSILDEALIIEKSLFEQWRKSLEKVREKRNSTIPKGVEDDISGAEKAIIQHLINELKLRFPEIDVIMRDEKEMMNPLYGYAKDEIAHIRGSAFSAANVILFNTNKVKLSTPIHEFAHIYFKYMRVLDPDEYEKWTTQAMKLPQIEFYKKLYAGITDTEIAEELLADAVASEYLYQNGILEPGTTKEFYKEIRKNMDTRTLFQKAVSWLVNLFNDIFHTNIKYNPKVTLLDFVQDIGEKMLVKKVPILKYYPDTVIKGLMEERLKNNNRLFKSMEMLFSPHSEEMDTDTRLQLIKRELIKHNYIIPC